MNLNRIVCPTDFSEASEAAFPWACRLARESGAVLLIVHVTDVATSYESDPPTYLNAPKGVVSDRAKLRAHNPDDDSIKCEYHHLIGEPGEEILRLAQRESADAVVMGSHGSSGVLRTLLGSVTEKVVRNAPCPVLILRPQAASDS